MGGKGLEECYSVAECKSDNGFFLLGSTESFGAGKKDFLLTRSDAEGNLLWARTYGDAGDDHGRQLVHLKDNSYIMAGYSESFDPQFKEILVIKFNETGSVMWSRTYGLDRSDFATYLQPTADGGFVVLGETINNFNHEKNQDILIFKVASSGNVEWSRIYGGNKTEYGYGIKQTSDQGYIISGETNSFGTGNWDYYLLKLKSNGDLEWSNAYGSRNEDYGRFAVQTEDGGYLFAGNSVGFGVTGLDIAMLKLDSKGNLEWAKSLNGAGTDYLLELKSNGNEVLGVGYTNSFGLVGEDAFLMSINLEKAKINWSKAFGGNKNDYAVTLDIMSTGEVIVAGTTNSDGAGRDDLMVVKVQNKWPKTTCFANDFRFNTTAINPKVTKADTYYFDLHVITDNVDISSQEVLLPVKDLCPQEYYIK